MNDREADCLAGVTLSDAVTTTSFVEVSLSTAYLWESRKRLNGSEGEDVVSRCDESM